MIKYKILHITDLHFRHNGRLFYSTGKKLKNRKKGNNQNEFWNSKVSVKSTRRKKNFFSE